MKYFKYNQRVPFLGRQPFFLNPFSNKFSTFFDQKWVKNLPAPSAPRPELPHGGGVVQKNHSASLVVRVEQELKRGMAHGRPGGNIPCDQSMVSPFGSKEIVNKTSQPYGRPQGQPAIIDREADTLMTLRQRQALADGRCPLPRLPLQSAGWTPCPAGTARMP